MPCPVGLVLAAEPIQQLITPAGLICSPFELLTPLPLLRRRDFEFLELAWLEQELGQGPYALPPLLLNKFLQLGRKQAAAAATSVGLQASAGVLPSL